MNDLSIFVTWKGHTFDEIYLYSAEKPSEEERERLIERLCIENEWDREECTYVIETSTQIEDL